MMRGGGPGQAQCGEPGPDPALGWQTSRALGMDTYTECGKKHGGKIGKNILLLQSNLILLFLLFY